MELSRIAEILKEPLNKFLDLPTNQEFTNCKDSGNVVNIQFPPELIKILEKLADKL
ncbi:MAG: hypothetical protein M0R38_01690 [Bacteroidia bacterium]|nr:hypothetical protein [Bacteroidia bacterium]